MGIPTGFVLPANFSTVNTKTVYLQKDMRTPYVQNWHLSIQQELTQNVLLDLGYVGNHSELDLRRLSELFRTPRNCLGMGGITNPAEHYALRGKFRGRSCAPFPALSGARLHR
jgi:hypothetical protein